MHGPDHYRTAQELSARTDDMIDSPDATATDCIAVGIAALTHAVLAIAPAIIDTAPNDAEFLEDWKHAEGENR